MSTISLLPSLIVTDGVQINEDWKLSIAFYLADGVTPIPLTGLIFTVNIGNIATLNANQIAIAGPSQNVLLISAYAMQTKNWSTGVYPLTLSVTDGQYTRSLFISSTLSVGSAQLASVTLAIAPDTVPNALASPISAALASAFQALQPGPIATSLANLSSTQLFGLTQALFATLPIQGAGQPAPVSTGQPFINSSGFVVIAQ